MINLSVRPFGANADSNERKYRSKALYTYTVDGQAYEGSRISPWVFVTNHNARKILEMQLAKVERLSGERVVVHYDPKKPQKSYLIVAGWAGIFISLLVALLPLLAYVGRFHL